jgi:hypothetical protein
MHSDHSNEIEPGAEDFLLALKRERTQLLSQRGHPGYLASKIPPMK